MMISKKQFLLNVSLVVMALFVSIGVIYSVKAEEIDTTSCNGVFNTYYLDSDDDGYGNLNIAIMACAQPNGYSATSTDCNDGDADINPLGAETCDGIDNNCNGEIDEGVKTVYYYDLDLDGYGVNSTTTESCEMPVGYAATDDDCNDDDEATFPGAIELCDDVDNDCDGAVDEDCASTTTYYLDYDNDGFGNDLFSVEALTKPIGYVEDNTDCDDSRDTRYPGNTEVCDGVDNDCDDEIDEELTCGTLYTYYRDYDGDTYGNNSMTIKATVKPSGYVEDNTDCDDDNASKNPGETEVCDDLDNDCDGEVDEGLDCDVYYTYYRDYDGDTYGDNTVTITATTVPSGYVADNTDCDDGNASQNPGETEVCDGIDNDCDGLTDEGSVCGTFYTYYRDVDGDTYGNSSISIEATSRPSGYVTDNTDCDDGNASRNPGEDEVCDGIDNDCDGEVDEGSVCADNNNNDDCGCDSDDDDDRPACGNGGYKNHGQVVSAHAHIFNEMKKQGEISGREKGQLMKKLNQFKNNFKLKEGHGSKGKK